MFPDQPGFRRCLAHLRRQIHAVARHHAAFLSVLGVALVCAFFLFRHRHRRQLCAPQSQSRAKAQPHTPRTIHLRLPSLHDLQCHVAVCNGFRTTGPIPRRRLLLQEVPSTGLSNDANYLDNYHFYRFPTHAHPRVRFSVPSAHYALAPYKT